MAAREVKDISVIEINKEKQKVISDSISTNTVYSAIKLAPTSLLKFATPGSLKSNSGIPEAKQNSVKLGDTMFALEKSTVYDLEVVFDKTMVILKKSAAEIGITENELITVIIASLLQNGTARNKINSLMMVQVAKATNANTKHSSTESGVFDIAFTLREIEKQVTGLYSGIKLTDNSANGGKTFLRLFAPLTYKYLERTHGPIRNYLKIAQKLNVTDDRIAILCNPAFPDIKRITKKDAMVFLKLMALYMRRTRLGKSVNDVLGKPINQKDIFVSLASRLYAAHPDLGILSYPDIEKMYETSEIPKESEVDLGSEYSDSVTLLSLIRKRDIVTRAITGEL